MTPRPSTPPPPPATANEILLAIASPDAPHLFGMTWILKNVPKARFLIVRSVLTGLERRGLITYEGRGGPENEHLYSLNHDAPRAA